MWWNESNWKVKITWLFCFINNFAKIPHLILSNDSASTQCHEKLETWDIKLLTATILVIFCELWFLDSLVVKNGLAHAWLENFSQNYCHNSLWNYFITFDAWRWNILLLWINRSAIFPIEIWIHYCWHKVWQDLFGE